MINSKRFIVIAVGLIIFCIGVFVFKFDAMKLGAGIAAIITPYIAGQSFRSSGDNFKY